MTDIAALVADNLELWTDAIERKSGVGRGGGKKVNLYGIERLRALILDLAVRGKLVPQSAADESASSLLKSIRKNQADLVESGRIGKPRKLPVAPATRPFEIPSAWQWVQLSEIGHDWGQRAPDGDFTYIDVGSIDQTLGLIREPSVLGAKDAPSRARKVVKPGTVIYSTVRPYLLNIAIVDQAFEPEPIASTAFAIIHPFDGIEAGFLYRYLRSPAFVQYVEGCQTGIAYPAINDRQFFSAWFPLPPLAEQRRIVAKVDELTALCDTLETQCASGREAHQTLVETLLATLVNSAHEADLATNWARLESHFDTLFATDASIDAFKQTILDLAVRGKLVKQDAKDEAAEKMLMRIASDNTSGGKAGKNGASTVPPVADVEVPFGIPSGWVWARFSQVARIRAELVRSLDFPDAVQIAPDVIEKGTGKLLMIRTVAEAGVRGPNSRFYAGQIIYSKIRPSLSKAVIAQFDGLCSADMYPLDALIDANFLLRLILSEPFLQQVRIAENRIKMPKLNKESLNAFVVPIPPLAEQHRIVAKVDELMALCDTLKARITDATETRRHMADAIIERAVA